MKFRIVNHWNKENGKFLGYSLKYKPFSWIPFYWREIPESIAEEGLYKNIRDVEHDLCFLLKIKGVLGKKDVFL